ncbi:hypothetical protein HPB50_027644 [Hyalomma asiaticum]|nr:hypothetical protein HPB50_027644 [Hyalomma asiaticum]
MNCAGSCDGQIAVSLARTAPGHVTTLGAIGAWFLSVGGEEERYWSPRWLPSLEHPAVLPRLPGEPDVTIAPRNSGSVERPPTRRPQKKRPGGRALRKRQPVAPVQRRKMERRSVATWTHLSGTEAPRYFCSDAPWKAQQRVRRDLRLDRVPWPFRGCAGTQVDAAAQGAQWRTPPEAVLCAECRDTVYHDSHYQGRRHAPRAGPAADDKGRAGEATMLGDTELEASASGGSEKSPGSRPC